MWMIRCLATLIATPHRPTRLQAEYLGFEMAERTRADWNCSTDMVLR